MSSLVRRIGWLAPLLIVLATAGIIIARLTAERFDFAIANIVTLICGFVICVTVASTWLRISRASVRFKLAIIAVPFVAAAVALLFYQPIGVDSELVPRFRPRWQQSATVVISEAKPLDEKTADLEPAAVLSSSLNDYPGFLGADRRATVTHIKLADPTTWDSKSPQLLWKQAIGAGWSAFSVAGNIAVTLEQSDEAECLRAYELSTGKRLWDYQWPSRHATSLGGVGPRSTPTIAEGVVFAQGANGILVAVKLQNGEKLWEIDLLQIAGITREQAEKDVAWGRSSSPLFVAGKVVVPLGGATDAKPVSLICLEYLTGKELWRSGNSQVSYASPTLLTLLGTEQIVSVNETSVSGHRIEDGTLLWDYPWPGASNGAANVSQPVAVSDESLLLSKAYGGGAALLKLSKDSAETWKCEKIWANNAVLKTKFTNVVLHAGYAFGLSDGILECVDLATGERKWKAKRYRHGQIMLVGEYLLIVAEDGNVAIAKADPNEFKELYKFQALEGMTWNNPALARDLLLVRNGEQAACYRLPLEVPSSAP